jgi:AraC family transcriptional regulator, transcriptional activator FtrA
VPVPYRVFTLASHDVVAPAERGSTWAARAWSLAHLDQPASVGQLAVRAGMTRRTFARRFLQETGTTPAQWLLQQRLSAAQDLLATTDHPIERVARLAGFPNPAAMRAHFQRRLRTTPSTYRKNAVGPVNTEVSA